MYTEARVGDNVLWAEIPVQGVPTDGSNGQNSINVVVTDGTTSAGRIDSSAILDGFSVTAGNADGGNSVGVGLYCHGSGSACSPMLNDIIAVPAYSAVTTLDLRLLLLLAVPLAVPGLLTLSRRGCGSGVQRGWSDGSQAVPNGSLCEPAWLSASTKAPRPTPTRW
ncbi:MAG: hypothetical protein WCD66_13615 [Rhodanobacteraceae bacterium]